jgi:hypothetical protein
MLHLALVGCCSKFTFAMSMLHWSGAWFFFFVHKMGSNNLVHPFLKRKNFIFLNYSYLFPYSQQTNKELCSFGLQMHACAISSFIYTLSIFKCLLSTGTSSSKMSLIYRNKAASALSQSHTFHRITTGGTSGARNATKKPTDDSTPFICSKCGCKRLRNRYHFACLNSYAHRAE